MKLHVENFAKIKEADIEINGITVIAGENNTGKSTIGKIMYCLYSIFKDIDLKVNNERRRTIARALISTAEIRDKIWSFTNEEDDYEKVMEIVNEISNLNVEELNNYLEVSDYNFSEETESALYDAIKFKKEDLKSLIIKRHFANEFNGQFLPLTNTENKSVLSLHIKNSINTIHFDYNSKINVNSELNLIKDCIYIDNPFSIYDMDNSNKRSSFDLLDFILRGQNIYTHKDFLVSILSKSLRNSDSDLIGYAVLDKRLSKFKLMINDVLHGDFLEKENKFVFFDYFNKCEIELENLSTGVKSLAILLKLIENRDISDNSMIVLDEPEIHLHPKWQIKFAEILVLLQKEFNLNIVLTSHSPYFISAIQAYSKKYDMTRICKYYLADLDIENKAFFEDVTDNPGKIFDKLAASFDELDQIMYGED